jgi:hypothetical protein
MSHKIIPRFTNAGNYNDASLLESQADRLYEMAENLGIVIDEIEE